MSTILLTFILQIEKRGVDTFRLAANAMNLLLVGMTEEHLGAEESGGGEAVFEIAVEDALCLGHHLGMGVLPAILDGVEGIEQRTPHKAHLSHVGSRTGGGLQFYTGVVVEGMGVHIAVCEEAAHHLLHALHAVGGLYGLGLEGVEAILPHLLHTF